MTNLCIIQIETEILLKYIAGDDQYKNVYNIINEVNRCIIIDMFRDQKINNQATVKNISIDQKIWIFLNNSLKDFFKIPLMEEDKLLRAFPQFQDVNLINEEKLNRQNIIKKLLISEEPQETKKNKKSPNKKKKKSKKNKKPNKKKKKTNKGPDKNNNTNNSNININYCSPKETEEIKQLPQNQKGYIKLPKSNHDQREKQKYTLKYEEKPPISIVKGSEEISVTPSISIYEELDSINYQIFENMMDSLEDLRVLILFILNKTTISRTKMLKIIDKYKVALYYNMKLYGFVTPNNMEIINNPQIGSFDYFHYTAKKDYNFLPIPKNVVFSIDIINNITNNLKDYSKYNNEYYSFIYDMQNKAISEGLHLTDDSIQFYYKNFIDEISMSEDAKNYTHLFSFHKEVVDKYWHIQKIIAEYLLVSLRLFNKPNQWMRERVLDNWQNFFQYVENTTISWNLLCQSMMLSLSN
jgi:hypothetical protein